MCVICICVLYSHRPKNFSMYIIIILAHIAYYVVMCIYLYYLHAMPSPALYVKSQVGCVLAHFSAGVSLCTKAWCLLPHCSPVVLVLGEELLSPCEWETVKAECLHPQQSLGHVWDRLGTGVCGEGQTTTRSLLHWRSPSREGEQGERKRTGRWGCWEEELCDIHCCNGNPESKYGLCHLLLWVWQSPSGLSVCLSACLYVSLPLVNNWQQRLV